MNVALIALPPEGTSVIPPLALAYIAGVLEQRRHIVRIYDLALHSDLPLGAAFRPLRAFRPQVVVVAGDRLALLEAAIETLSGQHHRILPIRLSRESLEVGCVCAQVLAWIDKQCLAEDDNLVINQQREGPDHSNLDLDRLPLPARHLLSLESYELRAVGGELQTTLLIGGRPDEGSGGVVLRSPAQIVTELRSVSREFGIRHYLFPGVKLTTDREWLHELLTRIDDANLGIGWDANADADLLDEGLLAQMARAGCERLLFSLDAARVFESTAARTHFKQTVAFARQQGIYASAELYLEPPYESIPHLVDVAATFGLDDVAFNVRTALAQDQTASGRSADDQRLEELARQRYSVGRSRQQLIDRYGPTLGMVIWKLRSWRMLGDSHAPAGLEDREDLARSA